MKPIILLDLNYTLVGNSDDPTNNVRYPARIIRQTYRRWLIDLIRPYRVFLITARDVRWRTHTLADLKAKEGWLPERDYWNTHDLEPPDCKQKHLQETLFPEFGVSVSIPDKDSLLGETRKVSPFFAIESNASTRAMYKRFGIPSTRCEWIKDRQAKIPEYA